MSNFNKVLLMGNLTRDPQVKQIGPNSAVTEFGLAVNRRYRTASGEDRDEAAFVDCSAFGRTGEVISQFCKKGKPLFIEGRLKYETWDDRQSGTKRSKLSVVVESFQFLSTQGSSPYFDPQEGKSQRQNRDAGAPPRGSKPAELPFDQESRQFEEADIPF